MKKCFFYMLGVILLAVAFSLTSCALEEPQFAPPSDERGLSASSTEVELMQRTASNDGSWDNIIDGASCFSIRFPYSVSVDGVEITIDSEEDLQLIENVFDAVDDDDDLLNIIFPITLTLADYSEVTINDSEELRMLVAECVEGGNDDDIECIDFIYPITVFTFNPNFEQTTSVIVNNDSELRRFFAGLDINALIGLDFPISFENYEGTKITVNNNAELSEAIQSAINACDEDDDNDYSDDDFTEERLDALLVACPWLVKEVKRGNEYTTADYENYVLNFEDSGSVTARDRQGNLRNGEWSTSISDYRVVVVLNFEFITEFNLEWFVDDIDDDRIKLFTNGDDKIIMRQYCEDLPVECDEAFIKETIENCNWIPAQEGNSVLDDFSIDFSNMNIHAYNASGEIVDEGNWSIDANVLTFNDLSMELANYIGEWTVVECSTVRFKLERNSETLVIEKDCE